MYNCEFCGKGFQYPSKLLRHLDKKIPCFSSTKNEKKLGNIAQNEKNVCNFEKNVCQNSQNVAQNEKNVCIFEKNVCREFKCEKCSKVLKSKLGLERHLKICKGVHSLQCPTCLKTFSDRTTKHRHIKNGRCSPLEEREPKLKDEILALRKENAILKASQKTLTTSIINNNKTINNSIIYNINYNPETKCLTTEDPNAPSPELLCFDGFKYQAAKSKLKDIDQQQLQEHIDNVRLKKDFYSLYSFFFRNVDNRRLHMFNLGKNNNTTHAQVFNNGAIEKVEKSLLFENVSKYIGQYLLNMSIENADVIYTLTTEQASKTAFLEVTRDRSHTFDYFRGNSVEQEF